VVFEGVAGHAGTVPMHLRHDALTAAAEFILAVERIAGTEQSLVGTVGQLHVAPGASNVIPGRVELTLDLRHPDERLRARIAVEIQDVLSDLGKRRGVTTVWNEVQGYPTVECDLDLVSRLLDAVSDEGYEAIQLPSGAGHDAVALAAITPVAMLFVRCKGGVSHNPAESITAADAEVGLRTIERFMDGIAHTVATSVQLED
jgi:allantoate deiminase